MFKRSHFQGSEQQELPQQEGPQQGGADRALGGARGMAFAREQLGLVSGGGFAQDEAGPGIDQEGARRAEYAQGGLAWMPEGAKHAWNGLFGAEPESDLEAWARALASDDWSAHKDDAHLLARAIQTRQEQIKNRCKGKGVLMNQAMTAYLDELRSKVSVKIAGTTQLHMQVGDGSGDVNLHQRLELEQQSNITNLTFKPWELAVDERHSLGEWAEHPHHIKPTPAGRESYGEQGAQALSYRDYYLQTVIQADASLEKKVMDELSERLADKVTDGWWGGKLKQLMDDGMVSGLEAFEDQYFLEALEEYRATGTCAGPKSRQIVEAIVRRMNAAKVGGASEEGARVMAEVLCQEVLGYSADHMSKEFGSKWSLPNYARGESAMP